MWYKASGAKLRSGSSAALQPTSCYPRGLSVWLHIVSLPIVMCLQRCRPCCHRLLGPSTTPDPRQGPQGCQAGHGHASDRQSSGQCPFCFREGWTNSNLSWQVPIIKFRDRATSVHVDISFNMPTGPEDALVIKVRSRDRRGCMVVWVTLILHACSKR